LGGPFLWRRLGSVTTSLAVVSWIEGKEKIMEVGFCEYCRKPIQKDYRFCPYCGKENQSAADFYDIVEQGFKAFEKKEMEKNLGKLSEIYSKAKKIEEELDELLAFPPRETEDSGADRR
jgi:predicted amidophosphoribosyltransferase